MVSRMPLRSQVRVLVAVLLELADAVCPAVGEAPMIGRSLHSV